MNENNLNYTSTRPSYVKMKCLPFDGRGSGIRDGHGLLPLGTARFLYQYCENGQSALRYYLIYLSAFVIVSVVITRLITTYVWLSAISTHTCSVVMI